MSNKKGNGKEETAKAAEAEVETTTEESQPKSATKVKYAGFMPREEAISYFESIVAGLKKGTIRLKQGEETLVLEPPSHLDIEVKAQHKGEKGSIAFEIAWRVSAESELTISSS